MHPLTNQIAHSNTNLKIQQKNIILPFHSIYYKISHKEFLFPESTF